MNAGPLPEHVVRDRIREGNQRRQELRRGPARRVMGQARAALVSACLFAPSQGAAAEKATGVFHRRRLDILEISAGRTDASLRAVNHGWCAVEPINIVNHYNIANHQDQNSITSIIDSWRPRLVIISMDRHCVQHGHGNSPSASQQHRNQSSRNHQIQPSINYSVSVINHQLETGSDAVFDYELALCANRPRVLRELVQKPGMSVDRYWQTVLWVGGGEDSTVSLRLQWKWQLSSEDGVRIWLKPYLTVINGRLHGKSQDGCGSSWPSCGLKGLHIGRSSKQSGGCACCRSRRAMRVIRFARRTSLTKKTRACPNRMRMPRKCGWGRS